VRDNWQLERETNKGETRHPEIQQTNSTSASFPVGTPPPTKIPPPPPHRAARLARREIQVSALSTIPP